MNIGHLITKVRCDTLQTWQNSNIWKILHNSKNSTVTYLHRIIGGWCPAPNPTPPRRRGAVVKGVERFATIVLVNI